MELCLGFIKLNAKKINKSYFKMQKKACTNPLLIDIHVTSIKRKWQYTWNKFRISLLMDIYETVSWTEMFAASIFSLSQIFKSLLVAIFKSTLLSISVCIICDVCYIRFYFCNVWFVSRWVWIVLCDIDYTCIV